MTAAPCGIVGRAGRIGGMTAPGDTIASEVRGCEGDELVALLRERERVRRLAEAEVLEVVGAILDTHTAGLKKYGSAVNLLQEVLLLSPTEASRRIKRARALCPSTALTGELLPPPLEVAAAAMRRGDLADSQLDAILGIVGTLPPHVNIQERAAAERSLVEHASQLPAKALNVVGRRIHDQLDPDGPAPSEKDNEKPKRELFLHIGRDGRLSFRGSFDAETGTLFNEI